MTPSPHPSTSCLHPLNPATSHNNTITMADYMLVIVPQKIWSLSCNLLSLWLSVNRSSSSTSLTVNTKDSGFLEQVIFVVFLLCSVSPSTVCLQRTSLMRMPRLFFSVFVECQTPPICLEYELQCFRTFSADPFGRKYS